MGLKVFAFKSLIFLFLFYWHIFWLCICALFIPYRKCVQVLAKIFRPDLTELQTGLSCIFAIGNGLHGRPMCNICCFAVIDGNVRVEKFREAFEQNLLHAKDSNGDLRYRKLMETYTNFMGYSFGQRTDFCIEENVRDWDYEDLKFGKTVTEDDVRKISSCFLKKPWAQRRSPWECLIIHGFKDRGSQEGERQTVMAFRWDHTLADGYSFYLLLRRLLGAGGDYHPPTAKKAPICSLRCMVQKGGKLVKMLADGTSFLYESSAPVPEWGSVRPSMEFNTALSGPVPVDRLKKIKNKFGINYFAVSLAAVSEAFYKIYTDVGMVPPSRIKCYFPLAKPNHPGGLTNHIYAGGMVLDIAPSHSPKDLQRLNAKFEKEKSALYPQLLDLNIKFASYLPSCLWSGIGDVIPMDFIGMGNLPVSSEDLSLDGHRVIDGWCAAQTNSPTPSFKAGVNFSGLDGKQRFYLHIDKSIFPSQELFKRSGGYIDDAIMRMYNSI